MTYWKAPDVTDPIPSLARVSGPLAATVAEPEVIKRVRLALLADLLETAEEISGAHLTLPGFDTWLHTPGQVEDWLRLTISLVTRDEWDEHIDPRDEQGESDV